MKNGILLVNLGTPDRPDSDAVKAFLGEFLQDKRVVDLSRWIWLPVLKLIILPRRSPKVAALYKSIWMDEGSPLMVYSRRQADKLEKLTGVPVALGMTYGNPSIQSGIEQLKQQGVDKVTVLPLYPQYSGTTTGAVEDALEKALSQISQPPQIELVNNYHDHPLYIKALAEKIRSHWQKHGQADYLLCSFHGIPQRYADNGDIYPKHCEKTTQLLAEELGLSDKQMGMSYQSRFGREEWLKPYTDETLEQLPKKSIKRLDIITPAFSADCLETLEEIAQECKEIYLNAGGESYHYIDCLNDDDAHIEMMDRLCKEFL
ncbi:ferrochelatase [Vibrio sp. SCSIO 43137]|uniref:ferrochelatase n=1 Tax=Vibrio sp. SCSIO 43137 TaxID=3021011 RepID=UPI0023081812|nr:ferrochelatase [Vibrio sp. SCSIO 43137]WCE30512.1 ferrochelatase [Vibrio sp. SCSIO 43137]